MPPKQFFYWFFVTHFYLFSLLRRAAYLQLSYSEATFGGSINVTAGQYGQAYAAVLSNSRASVAGDITVLGGSYDYSAKKRDNNDNENDDSVEGGEKKRGFSLDGSGLAVDYDSLLQVRSFEPFHASQLPRSSLPPPLNTNNARWAVM